MEEKAATTSMLSEAAKIVHEPSVLRRLLFATSLLPEDTPKLWEIVAKFATFRASSSVTIHPKQANLIADNINFTDEQVQATDNTLLKELVFMPVDGREHVGIIFISKKKNCVSCGGKLLIRADRPSHVTLYTDSCGTLPALHYRKYCANSKRGCKIVQHYGYHTKGPSKLHFDENWDEIKYLMSSQETAFELQILYKFDFELLIGQVSYKQKAEIYNAIHGYEDVKKRCSKRCSINSQECDSDCDDSIDAESS